MRAVYARRGSASRKLNWLKNYWWEVQDRFEWWIINCWEWRQRKAELERGEKYKRGRPGDRLWIDFLLRYFQRRDDALFWSMRLRLTIQSGQWAVALIAQRRDSEIMSQHGGSWMNNNQKCSDVWQICLRFKCEEEDGKTFQPCHVINYYEKRCLL